MNSARSYHHEGPEAVHNIIIPNGNLVKDILQKNTLNHNLFAALKKCFAQFIVKKCSTNGTRPRHGVTLLGPRSG